MNPGVRQPLQVETLDSRIVGVEAEHRNQAGPVGPHCGHCETDGQKGRKQPEHSFSIERAEVDPTGPVHLGTQRAGDHVARQDAEQGDAVVPCRHDGTVDVVADHCRNCYGAQSIERGDPSHRTS